MDGGFSENKGWMSHGVGNYWDLGKFFRTSLHVVSEWVETKILIQIHIMEIGIGLKGHNLVEMSVVGLKNQKVWQNGI